MQFVGLAATYVLSVKYTVDVAQRVIAALLRVMTKLGSFEELLQCRIQS
jgi:hypothetical protein